MSSFFSSLSLSVQKNIVLFIVCPYLGCSPGISRYGDLHPHGAFRTETVCSEEELSNLKGRVYIYI